MSTTAIQAGRGRGRGLQSLKYFHCVTQVLLDTDETGRHFPSFFSGEERRMEAVLAIRCELKRVKEKRDRIGRQADTQRHVLLLFRSSWVLFLVMLHQLAQMILLECLEINKMDPIRPMYLFM